ncbi:NitT/TauT family transport system ATP-binding protein [Amorphus suaedae]
MTPNSQVPVLEVVKLHHSYAPGATAIAEQSFEVYAGEFVSIVGPSGCGKTTLLKVLAGLLKATSGSVALEGRVVTDVPEGLAMVFQEYSRSLQPWLKVRENVELPLKYQPIDAATRRARVDESLEAVGLTGAAGRYPWQLSGGMQQRVAIARAIAYRPKLMLMDEPFASVDAQTRADLEDLVLDVHQKFGITTLIVTHDIDEAVYLADRVIVLSASPSRVVANIPVPLPLPRDQIETKEREDFVHIRSEVATLIRRPAATRAA